MGKDWWTEAVRQKAEEAEEKFVRGGEPEVDDLVAVALAHPEKFEIAVREKKEMPA